jgi:hypothetical protein
VEPSAIETWGTPVDSPGQFNDPRGVGFDRRGFAYIAESGNARIQKVDPEGNTVALWPLDFIPTALDATPDGEAAVLGKQGISTVLVYLDCSGSVVWQETVDLWASDVAVGNGTIAMAGGTTPSANNIRIFSRTGSRLASWKTGLSVASVAMDRNGLVHIIEHGEGFSWRIFATDGTLVRTIPVPLDAYSVRGLDIDDEGNAHIASWKNAAQLSVLDREGRLVVGPLDFRAYNIFDTYDVGVGARGEFLISVVHGGVFKGTIVGSEIHELWRRGERGPNSFLKPTNLAASPSGWVAVVDKNSTKVFRPDGTLDRVVYATGLALALDEQRNLYLAREEVIRQTEPHCEVFVPRALESSGEALFVLFGKEFRFSCPSLTSAFQTELSCGVLRVLSGNDVIDLIDRCGATMTLTPDGDLLLLDGNNVHRYGTDGTPLGSVALSVEGVRNIASGLEDNLYLSTDEGIFEASPAGALIRSVDIPELRTASPPIATDASGVLYVLDVRREVVYRIP